MQKYLPRAVLVLLLALAVSAPAKTITVTTTDNVSPPAGQTNLVQAINLLQDGDTIAFNIPGSGVHYLNTPVDGYPLITKNNITIDGYTQPGATPNTSPIHAANNAQLKIVLSSTNGNALSMGIAVTNFAGHVYNNLGFGETEMAILGFFRATNVTVRGLAIVSSPLGSGNGITDGDLKSICFCADAPEVSPGSCANWHVSGCWFGVDPGTRQLSYMPDKTTVATPTICIAAYRTRNDDGSGATYPQPATIGVAAGSSNPRAEFNVFITGYGFDSEGLNYRISGNFFNVLPDGLTGFEPMSLGNYEGDGFIEVGRSADNVVIGTDGDGVNDADEGNVFGGSADQSWSNLYLWSAHATNVMIAGNWYGVGVDGSTRLTNASKVIHGIPGTASIQFGSDLDGTSDALEGNTVFNNNPFAALYPNPDPFASPEAFLFESGGNQPVAAGVRISARGNKFVNNFMLPYPYIDGANGRLDGFTNYSAVYMSTNVAIIPGLDGTNSVYPNLIGTFAPGVAPYTNVTIDVYQLDQDGWSNGVAYGYFELTDPLSGTKGGFPQGSKYLGSVPVSNTGSFNIDISKFDLGLGWVTVTANYSADPAGTHHGKTHTSNFSTPVTVSPGGAASVGVTHTVPDVALWYDSVGNFVTNGPVKLTEVVTPLGNWEPYISVMGDTTFLIGFNTYANDGSLGQQNFVVAKQPASGGPAKVDYEFYDDSGNPFKGIINLSRNNGNPQRIAGDKRPGATHFITEAETSIGQISAFQSVSRWGNNPLYQGNDRYCSEQVFSLDPATLVQTPVTNAWDFVFGNFAASAIPASNNAPQLSRTGGRPEFLDNGNIVVMIDDKTGFLSSSGEVTSFAIIKPDGTFVKGPTLVDPRDIWDNMAAYKGGFAIRVHNLLYFFDNNGTPQHTNDINLSSGLTFGTGREDGSRIGGDIRSYYVYLAGQTPESSGSPVNVAIWDSRTGNYVAQAIVTDGDPSQYKTDRVVVGVDATDTFCVAYVYQPTADLQPQVAARVMKFDGQNISYLTHSFFPFVNSESLSSNVRGFKTTNPSIAMTTEQICIAAKGPINSTNNPTGAPDTSDQTVVYTVISNPSAQGAVGHPTITATVGSGNTMVLSWAASFGTFTLESTPSLSAINWTAVTPQPPIVVNGNVNSMTVPVSPGMAYFRLAK